MNVQKQVCTLEQAQKLYTLGISKTGHLFSWVFDKLNAQWDISNRCVESHQLLTTIAYPAFTVAELGIMIDGCFISALNQVGKWEAWPNPNNSNLSDDDYNLPIHGKYDTEAQCLSSTLIEFINNGILSVEKINQRLNS